MDMQKELGKLLGVLLVRDSMIDHVAGDRRSTVQALGAIVFAGVAAALPPVLRGHESWKFLLLMGLLSLFSTFLWVSILHVVAHLMGGQGEWMGLLRPLGYAAVLDWVRVLPFVGPAIGFLLGFWGLAITQRAIIRVHKLDDKQANRVLGVPVLLFVLLILVMMAGGGLSYGLSFGYQAFGFGM